MNRKDKSDGLLAKPQIKSLICSDSEPKDKSDTQSVAFNEVESSDQWIGKKSDGLLQATSHILQGKMFWPVIESKRKIICFGI